MKIGIARVYYPVKTLGPGDRIGIWVAGCKKDCPSCISPEMKDPSYGRMIEVSALTEMLREQIGTAGGVTISGGEPFDQAEALAELISILFPFCEDIIVFSGYTLSELRERKDPSVDSVLSKIGMLVDGPYVEALNDGTGMRGSSNQQFHVFRHPEIYQKPEAWERKLQVVVYGDKIDSMGIPGVIK